MIYYQNNLVTLYQGDCLEIMPNLDIKFDACITDPPYGINYSTFRTNEGNIENDKELSWSFDFCKNISNLLKNGSHLYCFFDPEYSAEFVLGFRENNFKIRNFLTIPRGIPGNGGDRIFQQQNEFCIFATKGKKNEGRKFNETQILKPTETYLKDKRYKAKELLYRLPDYWYWTKASVHNAHREFHPTQKNVECIEYMLKISTGENELILDCFAGSGTTGVACMNLNRKCILIEKDEKYCEIIVNRLKEIEKKQEEVLF